MPPNRAKPRFETLPTPGAKVWTRPLFKTATRLGTPLMPWQKRAGRLVAELREDLCICHDPPRPLPRYKLTVASVPRQQGKSALMRSVITTVAEMESGLEIYGTAQSRQYAARHVLRLGDALQDAGDRVKVLRGVGAESVTWPNGSFYLPISPTEGGGHGDSISLAAIDEGWALLSHVMGGIRPAMVARPHSQMIIISTMGTLESDVWNRIVARGREAVENGGDMAYIEYSAERDEDVFDESKWGSWMPALGITVSREDIRSAIADVEPTEAIRAFANRTVASLVSIFPSDWVEDAYRAIQPPQRFVVAVDVNDTPAGSSVTTGHLADDGKVAIRPIEYRAGSPAWVPGLVEQLVGGRTVDALVGDMKGPTRQIAAELEAVCERSGVALVDRMPMDLGADTLSFYDSLRERTVVMVKTAPLQEAIAGAARKTLGDQWLISRRAMSVDASPLISAILAYGLTAELSVRPVVSFDVW